MRGGQREILTETYEGEEEEEVGLKAEKAEKARAHTHLQHGRRKEEE